MNIYTFGELKEQYAAKRGMDSFASIKPTAVSRAATAQINSLRNLIWYWKGGWGFNRRTFQLTFVPAISNTITGTAGERVITFGTAVNASYSGILTTGQFVMINSRMYRLMRRRSSTVFTIDSPLTESPSGASCKIYFVEYPCPHDFGAIRKVKRGNDPIDVVPEDMTPQDNNEGESDFTYNAGRIEEDFLNSGTVNVTGSSNEFAYSGTVSVDHIGMSLLLKKSNAYQWFKVIDVDTDNDKWIVDRLYTGSTETGLSFALNPRGLQKIGFKQLPTAREVVEIPYTFAPDKMINDTDVTQLPDDTPMLAGIEVLGTKWETVGERGFINEVMYQDKKFVQSMKVLNLRGTPLQRRMFGMQDLKHMRHYPRNSNPWNRY